MKYILFLIALVCFACSNEVTEPPVYEEVCEDKQLGFEEVQYEPYYQYYGEWLTKACTSKRVGEPCTSYNFSYKITINECHMELVN